MSQPDPTKKNVVILALCQALGMSCGSMIIAMTALVGTSLAPEPGLGTLPFSLQFVGIMTATMPVSYFMKHFGRRAGFSLGALCGIASGLLGAQAILWQSFVLFCFSSFVLGIFLSTIAYYRFAAADTASERFRGRAISLVLAGGVLAAFLGPELAKWSREIYDGPVLFVGSFYVISVLSFLNLLLVQFVRIPRLTVEEIKAKGRPFLEIARQPTFIIAVMSGIVAYASMNLIMSITPAAMAICGHPFDSSAFVIQWHAFSMFAPSFITGYLISRFGVVKIQFFGAFLLLGAALVNLTGLEVVNFWAGLVLLGLGWNFLYVAGSTMLTATYRPEERARIQASNELLIFGVVAMTSFGSGMLFDAFGWGTVNQIAFVPVTLFIVVLLWAQRGRRLQAVC